MLCREITFSNTCLAIKFDGSLVRHHQKEVRNSGELQFQTAFDMGVMFIYIILLRTSQEFLVLIPSRNLSLN